jgi:ankyrin repeat protein
VHKNILKYSILVFWGTFLQITVGDENQQGQQNQTENSDVIEFDIENVIQQVDSKTSDVIDVENDDQQTPLHVAAKSGSVACVKYLIVAKANARSQCYKEN